ncbi:alpha/beta-hydrolase [Phanerochaete sordida]|uniref:Alpha/beta-hydrolase n=1 Tax=Phanerochaete sordida TaxID=48140 RepID=A0A9P3FYH5_9APHY|nr:alpha/beta-hydrolase [Phanerochaete sordida]
MSSRPEPVELEYEKFIRPDGNETEKPLVILHGLLGMKRNWLSLAKAFCKDLERPIYTLDLRNHGSSPHAEPMTYLAMAEDVMNFCAQRSLRNITLLGHSMGGKVAMSVALSPHLPEELLAQLIVADMAPSKGALSPEHEGYIEGMMKIEQSQITTRKDAQKILADYEPDPMTRAFLLTNLLPQEHDHHHHPLKFRVPLEILGRAIPTIGGFPYELGERTWEGPTLFIKGTRSKYINRHNIPIAHEFFPNMELKTLEAGHWVHAEKPNEFKQLVEDFIRSHEA